MYVSLNKRDHNLTIKQLQNIQENIEILFPDRSLALRPLSAILSFLNNSWRSFNRSTTPMFQETVWECTHAV